MAIKGKVKRCSRCNKAKPIRCFGQRSHSSDGLNFMCKVCQSKANKRAYPAQYQKRQSDLNLKTKDALRSRMYQAIILQKGIKGICTEELLGASIEIVRTHLQSLFKVGMNWSNHGKGKGKWHIDHIRPCASFDLTDIEQQKLCFHYTNLQPLWGVDNMRKKAKYDPLTH